MNDFWYVFFAFGFNFLLLVLYGLYKSENQRISRNTKSKISIEKIRSVKSLKEMEDLKSLLKYYEVENLGRKDYIEIKFEDICNVCKGQGRLAYDPDGYLRPSQVNCWRCRQNAYTEGSGKCYYTFRIYQDGNLKKQNQSASGGCILILLVGASLSYGIVRFIDCI